MKRLFLALLVTVPLLAQTSLRQDAFTLRQWLVERNSPQHVTEGSWATGYITGIADALDNSAFCIPNTATAGELNEVVIKYLTDNPTRLHQHRSVVVGLALADAYPCKP